MSVTAVTSRYKKKTVTLQTGGVTTLQETPKGVLLYTAHVTSPRVEGSSKRYNRFCNGNGIPKLKRLIFPSQNCDECFAQTTSDTPKAKETALAENMKRSRQPF